MPRSEPPKMTYTGVNESYVGQKPGLKKQKIMLEPGVYKTRTAKLFPQYTGWDDTKLDEMTEPTLKIAVTCPEKWLDEPTPCRVLKQTFLKHYRKKFPHSKLAQLEDSAIDLAIKDESLFLFSKKVQNEDAPIHKSFYDHQDVYLMLPEDWAKQKKELKKMRRLIVDMLAHCLHNVKHHHSEIVPVLRQDQIKPENTYVIFTGWHRQQCVIVKPYITVADLKNYLHEREPARMPMEALDIGVRRGDDIKILDDNLTMQRVWDIAQSGGLFEADDDPTEKKIHIDEDADEEEVLRKMLKGEGIIFQESEEDKKEKRRLENAKKAANVASAMSKVVIEDADDQGDIEIDTSKHKGEILKGLEPQEEEIPSVTGKSLILGVGKRIQDERHKIWMPTVHDPYSFRGPEDKTAVGGSSDNMRLTMNGAPKGWVGGIEGQAAVNQDDQCSIM